jgi:PEP-CTERM motif-containing protein
MKYKSFKQSLWLTLLSLLAIIPLSSSRVNATTLADLLAGGSLMVSHAGYDDLIFYNFHDYDSTSIGAALIPADNIIVTTRDTVIDGVREMGLRFSVGGMLSIAGQQQDIVFEFDVRTASGADVIIDDYLEANGGTRGAGLLAVSETVGNEEGFLDNLLVAQSKDGGYWSDTANFPGQDYLRIRKDVHVYGGSGDNCNPAINCMAFISDFSQLFSQTSGGTTGQGTGGTTGQDVPEPASMILLGLGLAGVGIARRKRESK